MNDHGNTLTWILSTLASSVVISTIAGMIPPFAAFIALIWYLIQIYESDTFRTWRATTKVKRIARLKAKLMLMESKPVPMPPGMDKL